MSTLEDSEAVRLARHALEHISDVLAEPSMQPGEPTPLEAAQLLTDVFERVGSIATTNAVELTVTGDRCQVFADRVRVMQVLTNLVVNAVAHARSSVAVTVTAGPQTVSLSVVDDGPGLIADQCETVFEPFTRLRNNTPGQGMGLALCRLLARAVGGDVHAAAGPGGRFTLTLPAA